MKVTDLTVRAVLYSVHHKSLFGLHIDRSDRQEVMLAATEKVVREADALREELGRTLDVALGRVPLLERFVKTWGRELLPPEILASPPDVLVLVPHALVHDLPLHLVLTDMGRPLGTVCGIAYCSGMTLFTSCVRRNPSRRMALDSWSFEEDGGPRGHRTGRSARLGGVDVFAGHDDAFEQVAVMLAACFDDGEVVIAGDPQELRLPQEHLDRGFIVSAFDPGRHLPTDSRPDVLCIIAHGDLDPDRHQLSGLLVAAPSPWLGLADIKFATGGRYFWRKNLPLRVAPTVKTALVAEVLTAAELELIGASKSELICLLGCSAGYGRVLQADEPASLAESFLKLGSSSVIAPMWDSHLGATGEWMQCFFNAWLHEGKPKALAVRDATSQLCSWYGPERAGVLTLRGDWL